MAAPGYRLLRSRLQRSHEQRPPWSWLRTRRAGHPWLAAQVTYRVEFGGGAQVQFHTLPANARDALIECATQLSEHPWDATVRPPGDDPRRGERRRAVHR